MAETSQATRKSIGGKRPQKRVMSDVEAKSISIPDHEGNDVNIVWCLWPWNDDYRDQPPPFPYQVYVLDSATGVAQNSNLPADLARYIEQIGGISDGNCHYRFEVYSRPFSSILACVAHQRKEVDHRNRNGIVPRLVSTWATPSSFSNHDEGYKGRIIVIDRNDWADHGVTLVSFDPAEYDHPGRYDHWNVVGNGDHDVVQAYRVRSKMSLVARLREWWTDAGHSWTEADLERRNNGGFSPALYPAVDPASHYDAEHKDVDELDGTAPGNPGLQNQAGTEDEDEDLDTPGIKNLLDKAELFRREDELPDLQSETYSDSFGLPITSVWSSERAKTRPAFSFTLYLAYDLLPLQPTALFGCLNKGLIAQEAWTLDVVQNMPSLEAAFQYHARASDRRTLTRVLQARFCIRMVLQKVAGPKLPNELLEYLEELLVPPEIPNYSSYPRRPFQDVCMYMDPSSLSAGPLLVYSNPRRFRPEDVLSKAHIIEPVNSFATLWRNTIFEDDVMRIKLLRYWHRVADELHVLWSIASPRTTSIVGALPTLSLKLEMPEVYAFGPYSRSETATKMHYTLQSQRTVTLHNYPFLSHDIWCDALEVVDLDTGKAIPTLPLKVQRHDRHDNDSWATTRELGFQDDSYEDRRSGRETYMRTIAPGGTETDLMLTNHTPWDWIRDAALLGWLVDGGHYLARLKPGTTVPRWTYGSANHLEGPYNLPPMPVVMEEEVRIKFCVEEEEANYL
ncbi:hypothetical protein LTR37_004779 [Vermiconidia calcicola]|uniref:Uncharacterized protein n=1 Tax=Vermiconidia calcicola TaxID=1690605 RepID=A0ACC3NMR9_9PEZI|nr:hypothetical protein LTR37_004779 [Vermiconidia calcicola]